MKLIVGLGNPGREYVRTRHNIGFVALEAFAQKFSATFAPKKNFLGEIAQTDHAGEKLTLLKPQTFMNRSGESVVPAAQFYKIQPADVIVVYDDLDLPLGRLRLAAKGGSGGHNGIKSIIQMLGTQEFPRLRLGIGRPKHPGQDPADYVLQAFAADEQKAVDDVIAKGLDALKAYLADGIAVAMNRFNGGVST